MLAGSHRVSQDSPSPCHNPAFPATPHPLTHTYTVSLSFVSPSHHELICSCSPEYQQPRLLQIRVQGMRRLLSQVQDHPAASTHSALRLSAFSRSVCPFRCHTPGRCLGRDCPLLMEGLISDKPRTQYFLLLPSIGGGLCVNSVPSPFDHISLLPSSPYLCPHLSSCAVPLRQWSLLRNLGTHLTQASMVGIIVF